MATSYSENNKEVPLLDMVMFLLILIQQLSSFFPNLLSVSIQGFLAVTLGLLCLKENKYKLINIPFFVWWYGFILVCLLSVVYTVSLSNSIGRLLSILFSLLFLGAITQYIKNEKDLMKVLSYYVIGGLLFVLISLILNFNDIVSGNLANVKFGMAFSYISIQTFCIMFWRYFYTKNHKVYLLLAILTLVIMILISGNKKAVVLTIIFAIIITLMKSRKSILQLITSLFIFSVIIALFFYLVMNNELLYNAIGERIEDFLNYFTKNGEVDKSTITRMSLIDKSLEVFVNNPVLGVGLDGFKDLNIFNVYAHNNFLELLSSLGLLGFIAYYWIYAYLLINLFKLSRRNFNSLAPLLFSLILTLLINDLGSISYYRISLTLFICISICFVVMKKKRHTNYRVVK